MGAQSLAGGEKLLRYSIMRIRSLIRQADWAQASRMSQMPACHKCMYLRCERWSKIDWRPVFGCFFNEHVHHACSPSTPPLQHSCKGGSSVSSTCAKKLSSTRAKEQLKVCP